MSAIDTLIAQVSDPRLRERLTAEWGNAKKEKKFGLVFEDHLPELLPLHGAKPRKGDLVCRRQGALKPPHCSLSCSPDWAAAPSFHRSTRSS